MSLSPILVTGAAGFIGARFVESCNLREIPVLSVDQLNYFAERPEHRGLDFGTRIGMDDLADWLKAHSPNLNSIIHLGACSDTTQMDRDYLKRVNIDYSKMLWELATRHRIPFYYASSAATYGAGEKGYDDDEKLLGELQPLNPYGESKKVFDLWALDQERAGKTPPTWAGFKFFNVYGFGERHKGKMASVALHSFDQIRAAGQVRLFRSHRDGIPDGHQKRDFIAVEDVIDVLHFARTRPIRRGIFNLGTGQARTFLDLAKAVFAALGAPEKIEYFDMPAQIRDQYQYFTEARMERLRREGYIQPFSSLEDGVRKYVGRLAGQNS
jgi:ADP-L-glycero-D-manno-heptose 6-epimerase